MYRLRPGLRLRPGSSGTFWAFDLVSGEHFELNETAFRVLESVERKIGPEAIAQELVAEYGVGETEAATDIAGLLETCVDGGLVIREA
jgi:hypothetical protein